MRAELPMRFRALPILLLLAPPAASAQVGHDPEQSPYRTLRYGQFIGATASYFNGVGGRIGVAPHKGAMAGLRYDFLGSGTITIGIAASYGQLDRSSRASPSSKAFSSSTSPAARPGTGSRPS